MAKKKVNHTKKTKADNSLMLLAGLAAIMVFVFAIFSYKTSANTSTPNMIPTDPIITVNLGVQNGSGESGVATLREVNGKVLVSVDVTNEPKGASQPAHIHLGSCPTPGAVKFPLNNVVNGLSSTVINTTLNQLKAMGPLAINLHKSASQSNMYVSCGNVKF